MFQTLQHKRTWFALSNRTAQHAYRILQLRNTTTIAWLFVVLLISQTGCKTLSLPAIDPTGNRIFSNQWTTIVSPHGPDSGYPSQQPAFQAPPPPPQCVDASLPDAPNTKGCLDGKLCNLKKREDEEIRGRCGQLLLTPTRIVAPVGGEVILLAGICGKDEYLVTNEPIEWMLAPDSVGQFVQVGDDAKGQTKSFWKRNPDPVVEKLDNDFARGRTSREAGTITRGTATPSDDLPIRKGQTWISVTSPSEGVSKVTAFAPDSDVWDKRRQTATIYWVDASWQFPQAQFAASGQPVTLVTKVMRRDNIVPAKDWIVRYRVQNPEFARFIVPVGNGVSNEPGVDALVDANGNAIAKIINGSIAGSQQLSHGTAFVEVEVVRPAQPSENLPELPLKREIIPITWSAPELRLTANGPEVASPGQPLNYLISAVNTGDLVAENAVVTMTIPTLYQIQEASIKPTKSVPTNQQNVIAWEIGPLAPRHAFEVSLILIPTADGDARITVQAEATNIPVQSALIQTFIQKPQLAIQFQPAPESTQVEVGNDAVFRLSVQNTGNQTLSNLLVLLESADGLQHFQSRSNQVQQEIGFLNPGQVRELTPRFTVEREGELKVVATIQSGGQVLATQQAFTRGIPATAKRPGLAFDIQTDAGPNGLRVGQSALVQWNVQNTGQVTLRNVIVSMQHALELRVDAASANHEHRAAQQTFVWNIPEIVPGRRVEFQSQVTAIAANPNGGVIVQVESPDLPADRKSLPIPIKEGAPGDILPNSPANPNGPGTPSNARVKLGPSPRMVSTTIERLKVSIQPIQDKSQQGTRAAFTVRVENTNNSGDQQVQLRLTKPSSAKLIDVRFGDAVQLKYLMAADGGSIDFEPIRFLRPNESFSCIVELEKSASGEAEIQAFVKSAMQTTPVVTRSKL